MHNDWINDLINTEGLHLVAGDAQDTIPGSDLSHVEITIQGKADLGTIHKILKDNGINIIDIKTGTSKPPMPGDLVSTKQAYVINKDVLIKTASVLYKIAKVELPAGYIGEVEKVNKNATTVKFGANLNVIATTDTGNICTVDYYLDTVDIPNTILTVKRY